MIIFPFYCVMICVNKFYYCNITLGLFTNCSQSKSMFQKSQRPIVPLRISNRDEEHPLRETADESDGLRTSQGEHGNKSARVCVDHPTFFFFFLLHLQMKLIEDKTLILVGLQNQLASLQERYELAYTKCLQWESNVSKIQDICNYEVVNLHLVKKSIRDIYLAMCKRKNIEPIITSDDYETKLEFIRNTLGEMQRVLHRFKSTHKRQRTSISSR